MREIGTRTRIGSGGTVIDEIATTTADETTTGENAIETVRRDAVLQDAMTAVR